MATRRRRFTRPRAYKNFRTLFVISTEGAKTEQQYFGLFKSSNKSIQIQLLCKDSSAPEYVLRRADNFVREAELKEGDEVWLVIDRDHWSKANIDYIYRCCCERNYNLAVSNPKFEYWLLLHFEVATGVATGRECMDRLKRHLPNYKKNQIELKKLEPNISNAVERAKRRDQSGANWPENAGTTVYRLVEKLLAN